MITDGVRSYVVFTYKCGLIEVGNHAVVGFVAENDFFANHKLSFTESVGDIDCVNQPRSDWNNVVFRIDFIFGRISNFIDRMQHARMPCGTINR